MGKYKKRLEAKKLRQGMKYKPAVQIKSEIVKKHNAPEGWTAVPLKAVGNR